MNSFIHRRICVGTLMHWCRPLDHYWSWLHRHTAVIHKIPHVPACLPAFTWYLHTYHMICRVFCTFHIFRAERFCCNLTILCLLEIWVLDADGETESKTKRTVMSLLEKVVLMDTFDRVVRIAAVVLWCEWSNVTFYWKEMKMPSREVLRPVFHWQGECTTGSSPILFECVRIRYCCCKAKWPSDTTTYSQIAEKKWHWNLICTVSLLICHPRLQSLVVVEVRACDLQCEGCWFEPCYCLFFNLHILNF